MNRDNNIQSNDNTSELQSSFEKLREVDAECKEWWNLRKLARLMGYDRDSHLIPSI